MVTAATLIFCLGALLSAGAGIFLLINLGDRREARTLSRVRPTAIGELAGPGRVAVEGVTEHGPAGPVVGPLSGEECVWYRVRLEREPSRADDSGHDLLLDTMSPGRPALADGTGRLPVDPRLVYRPDRAEAAPTIETTVAHRRSAAVTLPPVVPREVIDGLGRNEVLRLTEIRLPRGREVFALGRLTPDGLAPNRIGLSVFTTTRHADVLAARREDVALGGKLVIGAAAIGLLLAAGSTSLLYALG
ncbi:hypothetical protein AB0M54_33560 [Actinoplanes sp. NPDC051470]|uniref:hypothetical protein n=1 Tax=unclassified Actinoplanes TaxID=2626549 RepID=UPI003418B0FF